MSLLSSSLSPGTRYAFWAAVVVLASNAAAKTGLEEGFSGGGLSVVQFEASETILREGDTAEHKILKIVVAPHAARRLQIPIRLSGTAKSSDVAFQSPFWRPDPADPTAGVLTIPYRETSVVVPLLAVDDRAAEGLETLVLQISGGGPGWQVGSRDVHTLRINDPYQPPPIMFVGAEKGTVDEGQELRLQLASTVPLERELQIPVEFSSEAKKDLKIDLPLVRLGPDVQSAEVKVSIATDQLYEGNETVEFRIPEDYRNPISYTLGGRSTFTVSIVDGDPQPTFMLAAPKTAPSTNPLKGYVEAAVRSAKNREVVIALSTADGKPVSGLGSQTSTIIPAGDTRGPFELNLPSATWPPGTHALRLQLPAELPLKNRADGLAEILVQNLNYNVGILTTTTEVKESSSAGIDVSLEFADDVVAEQDLPVTLVATSPAVPACVPKRDYRLTLASRELTWTAAEEFGGWKTEVIIPKGEKSISLSLRPLDDAVHEPNKKLTLSISGSVAPERKSADFTLIDDNDSPPSLKVVSKATKLIEGDPQPTEFTLEMVGSERTEHVVKGRIKISGTPNVVVEPSTFSWTAIDADGKETPPPVFRLTVKDDDLLTTTIDEPARTLVVAVDELQNAKTAPGGEWRPALVDDELVRGDVLLLVACTNELLRLSEDGEETIRDLLAQLARDVTLKEVESRLIARAPLMLAAAKPELRPLNTSDWKLPGESDAFDKSDVDGILNAALAAEARITELRPGRSPLRVILIYPHNNRSGRSKFGANKLVQSGNAPAKRRVLLFPVHSDYKSVDAGSDLDKQLLEYSGDKSRIGMFDEDQLNSLSNLLGSYITRALDEF